MKKDILFKAISFIAGNDEINGFYFYNITLPDAIKHMQEKGIDVINTLKYSIKVYPW